MIFEQGSLEARTDYNSANREHALAVSKFVLSGVMIVRTWPTSGFLFVYRVVLCAKKAEYDSWPNVLVPAVKTVSIQV